MRKTSRISVGNPERKGPVGRLRRIWNNSIKKCFKDVLYESWTVFITQEQEPVAGSCKHGNECLGSKMAEKFLTS
jgi:hypothetical protein